MLTKVSAVQDAAAGISDWQTELQCLLAKASLQLPPQPPAPDASGGQPQTKETPSHTSLAALVSLADALAEPLPAWGDKLKAAGCSESTGVGRLLAKVQWQVVGVIHSLYALLAGTAAASPTGRTLDLKVGQAPFAISLHAVSRLSPAIAGGARPGRIP